MLTLQARAGVDTVARGEASRPGGEDDPRPSGPLERRRTAGQVPSRRRRGVGSGARRRSRRGGDDVTGGLWRHRRREAEAERRPAVGRLSREARAGLQGAQQRVHDHGHLPVAEIAHLHADYGVSMVCICRGA